MQLFLTSALADGECDFIVVYKLISDIFRVNEEMDYFWIEEAFGKIIKMQNRLTLFQNKTHH